MNRLYFFLSLFGFLAWIAWLGFLAFDKSHPIYVAPSQFMLAEIVAHAEFPDNAAVVAGKPKIVHSFRGDAPKAGEVITIANWSEVTMPYEQKVVPGPYLLLLRSSSSGLEACPRPNGQTLRETKPPIIYPWRKDVEQQLKRLLEAK